MDANIVDQSAEITDILTKLFFNPNAVMVLLLIGGLTEIIKRIVEKGLGWENKKAYIVILPMIPETLGMSLSLIPGMLPDLLVNSPIVVKLGFGIAGGVFASKAWKIATAFGEKPEPKTDTPPPAPSAPPAP